MENRKENIFSIVWKKNNRKSKVLENFDALYQDNQMSCAATNCSV